MFMGIIIDIVEDRRRAVPKADRVLAFRNYKFGAAPE